MPTRLRTRSATVSLVALLFLGCSGGDNVDPNPPAASGILALGDRHVCLTRQDRTVCWGTGVEGQLGIGATPTDTTPAALPDSVRLVALAAGQAHTCGLDSAGQAFCWGSDRDGQLGLGAPAAERCGVFPCATRPQPVAGDHRFRALAAGLRFTCGLTVSGVVYCWGLNDVGQLGTVNDGESCEDGRCSHSPVPEASAREFASITAGLSHLCALDSGGTAYCWGYNGLPVEGEHTNATFTPDAAPVEGIAFRQLSAGGYHTCGIKSDGSAYCWGIDALGAGPTLLEADHPVAVIGGIHFRSVQSARFTACGLDTDGVAYCWGPNISGEIGTTPVGGLQRFDQPVAVSGGMRFETIEPGSSTYCGLIEGGGVACWGRGEFGELGSGHENSTSPVLVGIPE